MNQEFKQKPLFVPIQYRKRIKQTTQPTQNIKKKFITILTPEDQRNNLKHFISDKRNQIIDKTHLSRNINKNLQTIQVNNDAITPTRRRYKTIDSRYQQSKEKAYLMQQMQRVKYSLKKLNLERQSAILQKQKIIKQKIATLITNNQINSNISSPYYNNNSAFYNHYQQPYYDPYGFRQHNNQLQRNNSLSTTKSSLKVNKRSRNRNFPHEQSFQKYQSLKFLHQNQKKDKNIKKLLQKNKNPKIKNQDQKFIKRMKNYQRYNHRQKNIKRLRNCFLAVYFIKCLEKLYTKIVNERKKFYLAYWPEQYKKTQKSFQNYFFSKTSKFFGIIFDQNDKLLPDQDQDSKGIFLEKRNCIKQLFRLLFQLLKDMKNQKVLGYIAWSFCKHGSFVDNGIINTIQAKYVSFNQKYGYLRMDKQLQKLNILSFIFIKHILYKFLLQPWNQWLKEFNPAKNKVLFQNIKLIGSVFYYILLEVQSQYISHVDTNMYKLGNYFQIKKANPYFQVTLESPILYQTPKQEHEQQISGLLSLQFIRKRLPFKKLKVYTQNIKQIIQSIHLKSCRYHQQFRDKVHGKKIKKNYIY